jgi:hypothetical protein
VGGRSSRKEWETGAGAKQLPTKLLNTLPWVSAVVCLDRGYCVVRSFRFAYMRESWVKYRILAIALSSYRDGIVHDESTCGTDEQKL